MRNLKRALSLALASIMVLGMMVVGAGAASIDDFSDKDKIVNNEAVSTLVALNVINGKDDGNYDPTGIVTRAEMAKLICVALNGGKDPQLGNTSTHTYSDTTGHWAEAYIEYCTQLKIVAGDGTGKFNPNATVTGTEAAKILLVAMGYNAEYEAMVGGNWAIATNVIANQKKLYGGLELNPSEGLTRDNAAQMVYNAINAKMVIYDYAIVPENGTVTSISRVEDADYTMLNKKFGAVKVEGVVLGNEFSNNAVSMEGKTTLAVSNPDELEVALKSIGISGGAFTGRNFVVPTGKDEFGRNIILYVKPATNSAAADKATVIADPIMAENTVVTTTKGFGSGKNIYNFAKDNGLKLSDYKNDADADALFFENYADVGPTAGKAAAGGTPALTNATFGVYGIGGASGTGAANEYGYVNTIGVEITLIDNDGDGLVDVALRNTSAFGQVTKYNTKDDGSVTVRADAANKDLVPSSEELKNIAAYDGIAVDDYVNVTKVSDTYYITKAEKLEGVLDSYKKENNIIKTVTVDGTDYTTSEAAYFDGTDELKAAHAGPSLSSNSAKSEGVFYLDAFGYAIALKMGAANSYAYIGSVSYSNTATSFNPGTLTVYAVLQDGTAKSYNVTKFYGSDGTTEVTINRSNYDAGNLASQGNLYKYVLDDADGIKLTRIDYTGSKTANKATAGTGTYNYKNGESTVYYDGASNKVTTTSDTVFFYAFLNKAGTAVDSVNVYVGPAKAPSIVTEATDPKLSYTYVMDSKNSNATAVLVVTKAVTSVNYLYAIDYLYTNNLGDVYRVYMDNKVQEITTNGAEQVRREGAYTYTTNADGLYNLKTTNLVETGTVRQVSGNSLILESDNEYNLSKAEIILIDGADSDKTSISKHDTVVVVYDRSTSADDAKNVFVVEEYDEGNAGLTLKSNASKVELSDTVDVGYKIKFKTEESSAATILSDFIASYGSTNAYIATQKPTLAEAKTSAYNINTLTATGGEKVDGTASGPIYYLVSVSEDGTDYSATKIRFLTGAAAPTFTTDLSASQTGYATLTVVATGTGTVTYQWYKDNAGTDEEIPGEIGASYTPSAPGTYWVVATNTDSSVTGTTSASDTSTKCVVTAPADTDALGKLVLAKGSTDASTSGAAVDHSGALLGTDPLTVTAIAGDGIKITYNATLDQSVTIKIGSRTVVDNAQGTGADKDSAEYLLRNADITAGELQIQVIVTEDGKGTTDNTYTVTVAQTKAAAPTAIALAKAAGTGTLDQTDLLTNPDVNLSGLTGDETFKVTVTAGSADGIKAVFTTDGAGTCAPEEPLATTVQSGVLFSADAGDDGKIATLTITVSQDGYADWVGTYTITMAA